MVRRLVEIFDYPQPPKRITQQQFDGAQKDLEATAKKQWHDIGQDDYWHTLLDFCYVDLQQDLFDYLFPALLIKWWEGLLDRQGGPASECGFYRAIDGGQLLTKMMSPERRNAVLEWMVDAYVEGVVAWGGHLSFVYDSQGPNDLHGPLWSFHSIGQSIPITKQLLQRLRLGSTLGQAQWWFVLAIALVWDENECPDIPPWNAVDGGGGVYPLERDDSIFDHGYLPENLEAFKSSVTYVEIADRLTEGEHLMKTTPFAALYQECRHRFSAEEERCSARLERLIEWLDKPNLGGVVSNPLSDQPVQW